MPRRRPRPVAPRAARFVPDLPGVVLLAVGGLLLLGGPLIGGGEMPGTLIVRSRAEAATADPGLVSDAAVPLGPIIEPAAGAGVTGCRSEDRPETPTAVDGVVSCTVID